MPCPEIIVDPGETVQVMGPGQGADKQYSAVSPAHKHWLIQSLGTINKGLPATTVTWSVNELVHPQQGLSPWPGGCVGLQGVVSLVT